MLNMMHTQGNKFDIKTYDNNNYIKVTINITIKMKNLQMLTNLWYCYMLYLLMEQKEQKNWQEKLINEKVFI